jgi:hypothetical protein
MNAITNAMNAALANTTQSTNTTMSAPIQQYHFDTNVIRDDPSDVITGRNGSYGFSLAGKVTARIASLAMQIVQARESPLLDVETGEIKDGLNGVDKFNELMSQLDALSAEIEGERAHNEQPAQALAGYMHARNLLLKRGVKVGSFVEHFKWRAEQTLKSANDDAMIKALAEESGLSVADIKAARAAKGKGQVQWLLGMATKAMQIIGKTQPDPMYTPEDFREMYLDSLKSARVQAVRNSNNLAEARATLLLLKACEDRADRQLPRSTPIGCGAVVTDPDDNTPSHDAVVDPETTCELREDDVLTPSYEDQVIELESAHDRGDLNDDEYDAMMVNLRGG